MTPLDAIKYLAWNYFYQTARTIDKQIASEAPNVGARFTYASTTRGGEARAFETARRQFITPFAIQAFCADQPQVMEDYIRGNISKILFEDHMPLSLGSNEKNNEAFDVLNRLDMEQPLPDEQLIPHGQFDHYVIAYAWAQLDPLQRQVPHLDEMLPAHLDVMLEKIGGKSPIIATALDSINVELSDAHGSKLPRPEIPAGPSKRTLFRRFG